MKPKEKAIEEHLLKNKIPGDGTGVEVKKTVCSICTPLTHCGINAYIKDGMIVKVEGSEDNPHSGGTLCSKGSASRQYVYHPDRLLTPLLKKGGRDSEVFESISWDKAFDIIGSRLSKIKKETGPESVNFFSGFQKGYRPFLQRLAHAFGSPNYSSESSCCFYALAMANVLNYGCMGDPDMPNAKCLLVWSTNPFYTNTPVVRHLIQAIEQGLKIIEVGPLTTPMTARADIHLRIRPGTSGALALGMARVIISERLYDFEFVENWTHGFEDYQAYVDGFTLEKTAQITGVSPDLIARAARLYATSKPAAMMPGASSVVHHTNGVQNQRAAAALIGLTGNMDRKGGNHVIPSSYYHVTAGIPTRYEELAQMRPWKDMPPRVGQDIHPVFCQLVNEAQSMHIPFQIHSQKPYPIRAIVAFGMNYRMWPGSDFMREALKKLDFFVDVDLFMTDTAKMADLEKNGGRYLFKGREPVPYEKYRKGGFPTPSGKMEFSSNILKDAGLDPLPTYQEPKLSPVFTPKAAKSFPLILTTGARLPMFIHSQTFRLPWTKGLRADHPMADINPQDAEENGISAGDLITLRTQKSSIRVKAHLTEIVPPGVVSMYHAYPGADVNELIEPDYRDPISGFPGFKSLLCDIKKV